MWPVPSARKSISFRLQLWMVLPTISVWFTESNSKMKRQLDSKFIHRLIFYCWLLMPHYFILVVRSWCLTCEALVKPTCVEAQHKTHSLLEEAEKSQTELDQVLNGFKEGNVMWGRVDRVPQTKLKANLIFFIWKARLR